MKRIRIIPALMLAALLAGCAAQTEQPAALEAPEAPAVSVPEAQEHACIELSYTLVPYPRPEPEEPPEQEACVPEQELPEETAEAPSLTLLDTFIATAYCVTGQTATGTWTTEHRTLAVNPAIIPYGTHVWLFLDDGTPVGDFYAEDTGANMMEHPYVVDIYMGPSYEACVSWGARHVSVYVES